MTDRDLLKSNFKRDANNDSLDVSKLIFIFRKSFWIILALFILGLSAAYLVIRYTKPLYQSSSVIKLNFESEANTLGLVSGNNIQDGLNEISGEIELLKSKLFLNKVVNTIKYPVAYYAYGAYLVDERYENNPFEVSFKIKDGRFYNRPVDIELIDGEKFRIFLYDGDGEVFNYGQEIIRDDINLLINKTPDFNSSVYGKYFFVLNSDDALINYFQSNMTVQPENFNAKTIKISLDDFNRRKAQQFVTAVDTLYLKYTTQTKNQAISQKINFLDQQIESTSEKLERFEEYFENFTIENRSSDFETDLSKTLQILNELDSQRFQLRDRYNAIKVLKEQIEAEDGVLNPYVIEQMPQFISAELEKYELLKRELEGKSSFYNSETAVITRLKNEIEKVRSDVENLITEHIKSYEKRLDEINVRIASVESTFMSMPSLGTDFNKNQRLYSLQENFLLSLRQTKMELEITKAGTVTESIILSPASYPADPIKPQKAIIFGIGFVSAFIISIVLVLVRYVLHNKISSLRELERITDIPLVGAIPEYSKEKLSVTRLVIDHGAKTAVSEALRTIRTNLEFLKPSTDTKVIAISSTIGGEGKTFVVVNLAAIIASTNKKVCVVDLDMRKPKIHIALNSESNADGVSTILIGKSKTLDCVEESSHKNLFYIKAGPTPPNPSELMLSEEFDVMLDELKKDFDLVILDTPPVGLVTDGVLAMKKSDVQLYVLKADYSKRSFVKTIENVQTINHFKNMGVILNAIPLQKNNYAYGHYNDFGYYGYGYGYYEEAPKKRKLFKF